MSVRVQGLGLFSLMPSAFGLSHALPCNEQLSDIGDNCPYAVAGGLMVYTAAVMNVLFALGAIFCIAVMCVLSST